jgi:hypothetical protein
MIPQMSSIRTGEKLEIKTPFPFSTEQLIDHFLSEQARNSRTFRGVSDTSTSELKQPLLLSGDELQERVRENVREVLKNTLLVSPPSFSSSCGAQLWIFYLSFKLNQGLAREGVSILRTWETKISYQTPCSELEKACQSFADEFFQKWQHRGTNPILFAAWIEQEWNGKIHPLSDGCGRSSKTLAAIVLAQQGLPYPSFDSREDFFARIDQPLQSWGEFYAKGVEKATERMLSSSKK